MQALKALAASPYPDPTHPLPKPIIIGGGAMMVAAVVFCALAHATGIGVTTSPPPTPMASRDFVFTEQDDGDPHRRRMRTTAIGWSSGSRPARRASSAPWCGA